jgi:hypothetical protein
MSSDKLSRRTFIGKASMVTAGTIAGALAYQAGRHRKLLRNDCWIELSML